MSEWKISKHGKVTVSAEGIMVEGFVFDSAPGVVGSPDARTQSANAAIQWAIERLEEQKGGEW